ncbi:MAG: class I SAM-dependent methyltransferase [Desulfuromonadales bacterium]|nr:class I SAM-dependent methyltransferase [Desulfuromonadales bacterium]
MDISTYYSYQAKARGLYSLEDVMSIVVQNTLLYDKVVLPWLPKERDAIIYEVACGPGIFLHWLKRHGYTNTMGSDSSDVQIILAKAGGLAVTLADAIEDLRSYPSGSFDCLVGLDFYEHLPKEMLLDFLYEAERVLRSGGRLILRGPNGDSPLLGRALYNDITHYWALTTTAFNAVLMMSGFTHTEFKDDTLACIQKQRWLRVPLAWMAQQILRTLLRLATREHIKCLSSSLFLCAWK